MRVPIVTLPHFEGLSLPTYQTPFSAGLDLPCALTGPLVLVPGERHLVPTGIKIALEPGYEGQVRPRSGLAIKHGIGLVNGPGTIDADYRGEVKVPLINHGQQPFRLERGMRIAQLIVAPVLRVEWERVDRLDRTERGEGGFGHTGN